MSPDDIQDLRDRLTRLEVKVDSLATDLAKALGSGSASDTLIKFVITPLLVILGALIGIKLLVP